jgi:transitional endoplasmic reticulum ATPase
LSTLLVEIDGISTVKDNLVIVIATTTDITSLDSSLLRPGRLELHLEVPLPDYSQRKAMIAAAIAKRFESFANSFDSIIGNLADITNGKSVADIVSYIDETLYGVIRHFVYDCIEVNEQNLERILYQKLLSY